MSVRAFTMPGWDHHSTWGEEEGLGHFYAQLYRNSDDRDGPPLIWITPPRHVVTSIDALAEAIAAAIGPFEPVPPPAVAIKAWMLREHPEP